MTRLYYVLQDNEIGKFADPSKTGGNYPMYFENSNGKIEMKNIKAGWMLLESGNYNYELIDGRSEVRSIADCDEALRIAGHYVDWSVYDSVQKSKRFEQLEVANAIISAILSDFNPLSKEILCSLREAEKLNAEGGPGSRKLVSDLLNRTIVKCEQQFFKLLKLTEVV